MKTVYLKRQKSVVSGVFNVLFSGWKDISNIPGKSKFHSTSSISHEKACCLLSPALVSLEISVGSKHVGKPMLGTL